MRRYRCPHCGRATKLSGRSYRRRIRGRIALPIGLVLGGICMYFWRAGELPKLGAAFAAAAIAYGIPNGLVRKPSWSCDTCGILFHAYAWQSKPVSALNEPLAPPRPAQREAPVRPVSPISVRLDVRDS